MLGIKESSEFTMEMGNEVLPNKTGYGKSFYIMICVGVVTVVVGIVLIALWQSGQFGGAPCDPSDDTTCDSGQWCESEVCKSCACPAGKSCDFTKGCVTTCSGQNVTCETTAGVVQTGVCDAETGRYKCPAGSCNTTVKTSQCAPSSQQCQADGSFLCSCGTGPDKNSPSLACDAASVATCINGSWQCACGGKLTPSGCEQASWRCESGKWTCECGGDVFDPTGPTCPPPYTGEKTAYSPGTVSAQCQDDELVCMCGEETEPEGARADCVDQGSFYVCTSDGFECLETGSICGDRPTNASCPPDELKCDPDSGQYYCPGACNQTTCSPTTDASIFQSSATRATWSVFCSTADDFATCMQDHGVDTASWQGAPFPVECSPSASRSADVCSRTRVPYPVSVPDFSPDSRTAYAGSIAPTNFLVNNDKYGYSGVQAKGTPFLSNPSASTDVSMGTPFVMVGVRNISAPKCALPSSAARFQWYVVPLAYVGTAEGVFLQPAQAFHPFLAWVTRPAVALDKGSTYQPTKNYAGKSIKQPPGRNVELFVVQHVCSLVYLNNKGCSASSGDGGRSCDLMVRAVTSKEEACLAGGDLTSQPPCISAAVQGAGQKHNNAFSFWAWSQDKTNCGLHPGSKPYGDGGSNADLTQHSPQYDEACVGTLTSPFINTEHRQNVLYFDNFKPSTKGQLYHRDHFSQIVAMSITASSGANFWDTYKPDLHWPVKYPTAGSAPYNQARSATFVAPLQYGLRNTVALYDVTLEAYSWVDESYDDWVGVGILVYGKDGYYSYQFPYVADGAEGSGTFQNNTVIATGSFADPPNCGASQSSDACCAQGPKEWNVWIQSSLLPNNFLCCQSTAVSGHPNFYAATFTCDNANALTVTMYGHLYLAANASPTKRPMHLCIRSDDSSLVFVDLKEELEQGSGNPNSYICPMWSLVKPN